MSMSSAAAIAASPMACGLDAMADGDYATAAALFHAEAVANPADYEPRYWLHSALVAAGYPDAAATPLAEARDLHAVASLRAAGADMERFRTDKAYCREIGLQLYQMKLMAAASLSLGRGLDLDQLDARTMLSYGLSLQHQGRMAEAIDVFSACADVFQDASVHEYLLYPLFHTPDRLERVLAEGKRWAKLYADCGGAPTRPGANSRRTDRKLNIGYVGPSFTRNQVAQFMAPILENHDPEGFRVFLYCADPAAEAPLPAACTLRKIGGLSDDAVADMVRADGIDILVDTWGHTSGSRLPVFARRPAPVQLAWINFLQTTGLDAMDYVLHADCMAVEGTAAAFTEEVWPIAPIMAPFRPSADRPEPVATPALAKGYVTFGSFNNPAKLSDETIAAWGAILRNRPGARLVLKYSYFLDPVLQRVTRARLAGHGCDPNQIEFRGHSTGLEYLRAFEDIDLALDPSPCPGGTTTCDALSNGVPVLTLGAGDFYARIGVAALEPCGLTELVAQDWQDYVDRALALTENHEQLDALRGRVRPAFENSLYRDEAGFTRRLESAFRQMFVRWAEA